ncbi:M23 family metallopeptidase [Bacillus sp. FSL W7-1360]
MDHNRKNFVRKAAERRKNEMKTEAPETGKEQISPPLEVHQKERKTYRHRWFMQALIAGCLFFALGIVYEREEEPFQTVQAFVDQSFEHQFQFAAVADWYEKQFGGPLHLLPDQRASEEEIYDYAIPASGIIGESSAEDGKGILLETDAEAIVKAVKGGQVVLLSNDKKALGKMIEVQHPDKTTSIYGMLDEVSVSLYDMIPAGTTLGKVMPIEGEQTGKFYFALRRGEAYVDPSDVMSFE